MECWDNLRVQAIEQQPQSRAQHSRAQRGLGRKEKQRQSQRAPLERCSACLLACFPPPPLASFRRRRSSFV